MGQSYYQVCSFLLEGKAVQGVKLRRYIEAAGRWAGSDGGYCINTDDGGVFGEAWTKISNKNDDDDDEDHHDTSSFDSFNKFLTWIKGQHIPKEYTNIKPTPVGPAYPLKAQVDDYAVLLKKVVHDIKDDESKTAEGGVPAVQYYETFNQFTMVRDDEEASKIASSRKDIYELLKTTITKNRETNQPQNDLGVNGERIEVGSWPKREE